MTQKGGRRCSTATAYLYPARRRHNLRIDTRALATRILFDGRRATGVALNQGGLRYRLKPGTPSVNAQSRGWRLAREMLRYALFRHGLLSLPAAHVAIFCKSRVGLEDPDIQFHVLPATLDVEKLIGGGELALERSPGLSMVPCQLRPESRGTVHIAGPDPAAPPEIRANYLDAALDQETIVAGLRWTRRIAAQPALAALIDHPLDPGMADADDGTLLAHARATGATAYHPVGTCRMGRSCRGSCRATPTRRRS